MENAIWLWFHKKKLSLRDGRSMTSLNESKSFGVKQNKNEFWIQVCGSTAETTDKKKVKILWEGYRGVVSLFMVATPNLTLKTRHRFV